jgi:hypothetical protein
VNRASLVTHDASEIRHNSLNAIMKALTTMYRKFSDQRNVRSVTTEHELTYLVFNISNLLTSKTRSIFRTSMAEAKLESTNKLNLTTKSVLMSNGISIIARHCAATTIIKSLLLIYEIRKNKKNRSNF